MSNAGNMGQFGAYGNVDPYAQQGQGMPPMDGGFMPQDMQNGMYNSQMGGMPNQQYADPMQQAYGAPMQGGMYYPQNQVPMQNPAERANHHAQIRTASIYGPKELHSPKIAEVERANSNPPVQNAAAVAGAGIAGAMGGAGVAAAQTSRAASIPSIQPNMQAQTTPAANTQTFQPQQAQQAAPQMQQQAQAQAASIPQVQAQPAQASVPTPVPTPAATPAQAPVPQPQMQQGYPQMAAQAVPPKKNGAATASLILGLLSIIFGLIPPIGIILGIVTLNISKKYMKRGGKADRALAGKIFGLIGLIFSILMLVGIGVCAALMFGQVAGPQVARDMLIYYNNSPLGQFGTFALPTVS